MRLLFYEWNSYLQYDIKSIFREKNLSFSCFAWEFRNKNEDEAFEQWFAENVDTSQYDAILSVNYWPMLSKVAQQRAISYIAWCYDNPLNVTNIENTLGNPMNHVFFFDRIQAKKYQDAGFNTVHYLPLGVNAARMKKIIPGAKEWKQYRADVSLVGSLYESRLGEIRQILDEYSKGYIEAALASQQNLYGCYLFDEMITEKFIENINDRIHREHPETGFCLRKEALTFAMASEVTRKDRLVLLSLLGKRHDTHLYSFQNSVVLQSVKCHSVVDYVTEMPYIFACSQINLNPVLRCIQSGIPLRALDIMAAGGFLLSSYQPELAEQFADGEEMVMYESMEDAVEKTAYYLQHEDVRNGIITNGRKKVLEQYSLQERLGEILRTAGLA